MARVLALLLLLLASLLPRAGSAQERICEIDAPGRTEQSITFGDTIIVLFDPFTVTCSDGAMLRANSGQVSRARRELHLTGNVYFQDPTRSLSAAEATYNSGSGRLLAEGDVVVENLQDRSTLRGPELEYLQATETRPETEMIATGRPQLQLPPPEGGADREALDLVADRVRIIGETDLTALGSVVITRTGLHATAGEAHYDSAREELQLERDALVRGEEFELAAGRIDAKLAEGAIQEIHALSAARLEGQELEVTAPELHLFFRNDLLEQAIAIGSGRALPPAGIDAEVDARAEAGNEAPPLETPERARAIAQAFRLEADSLDARFIEQRIDIVHAIGNARGESLDTLPAAAPTRAEPEILRHDWIQGDSITGFFVTLTPTPAPRPEGADTAVGVEPGPEEPKAELQRLLARGSAQSLYRMPPAEGSAGPGGPPNINFLVGDVIELELREGEVQEAVITGLQQGVFLEPRAQAFAPEAVPSPAGDTPDEVRP